MTVEDDIVDLIVEETALPRARVRQDARFTEDLGVVGSDIEELIRAVETRFGTDFKALHERWYDYFDPEGQTTSLPGAIIFSTILAVGFLFSDSAWAWLILPMIAMVLRAGYLTASGTWGPPDKMPFTVADLTNAVRAGKWEP